MMAFTRFCVYMMPLLAVTLPLISTNANVLSTQQGLFHYSSAVRQIYRRSNAAHQRRALADDGDDVPAPEGATGAVAEDLALFEDQESCLAATKKFVELSDSLSEARNDFSETLESKMDDLTDMRIGFPSNAVDSYRSACDAEGGYWTILEGENFVCDMSGLAEKIRVYGMGDCWANTTECENLDPIILVEDIWQRLGLDCRLATADDASVNETDASVNETKASVNETDTSVNKTDASVNKTAADDGDATLDESVEGASGNVTGDSLDNAEAVFLTPEDAACMDATKAFGSKQPALQAAASVYEKSVMMNLVDPTDMKMGYSLDSVDALQAACDKAGGYLALIGNENFKCDMNGSEQSLNVFNFGACLADVDECRAMDLGHLLESVWDVMGLICWNPKDPDDVPPDGFDNEDVAGLTPEDLDLSEDDMTCLDDTNERVNGSPDLAEASESFGESMEVDMGDGGVDGSGSTMRIGFPDEAVDKLKAACDENSGLFSLVQRKDFVCDMEGMTSTLVVTNIADCLANTKECKNMDPLHLMEDVWQAMGLQCTETEDGTEHDGDGDGSSSGGGNPQEDAEVAALGLTDSDVACMHDSEGFVRNSVALSVASDEYAKSVEMDDPRKLGFPAQAAATMEGVCKDEGGLWSAVDSEDVTCVINGHNRRINVYNFGNCVAKTDDCQAMDPIVLVKGFFYEIMNFRCWKALDGNGGASNNPSPTGASSTFAATSPSTGNDDMPHSAVAAIVLCLVVLIGFFAFYRYRKGQGRERISRRAYEMTDVSDLRFDDLT